MLNVGLVKVVLHAIMDTFYPATFNAKGMWSKPHLRWSDFRIEIGRLKDTTEFRITANVSLDSCTSEPYC